MKRHLLLLLCIASLSAAAPARAQVTTDALLDSIQAGGFRYFWYQANPANGLIRDRSQPGSPCSIASTGFGLSAICIGADHGWVPGAAAASRVLTTLRTFWWGPQGSAASGMTGYQGFFYHFLDMNTATRTWTSELSTIDTALLLAGILDCRQYFTGPDSIETQIVALADSIYRRCNWNFVAQFGTGPIYMQWTPENGFANVGWWKGYNEAMIMYLLAIGSPTHAVNAGVWKGWWCKGYTWHTQYGYSYVTFAPLFGHQYSHCWVDFRAVQDDTMRARGITYFENSRRATLAQRAYCIANPSGFLAYSDSLWGITASDDPYGYSARGAPPAQNDNGTLVPTAPISSIPFTPTESIQAAWALYRNFHTELWGPYGFKDAYNENVGWWDTDVIGIDQGPIVLMIENYRNGGVWRRSMTNVYLQNALQLAGFTPLAGVRPGTPPAAMALWSTPNPMVGAGTIRFRLPAAGHARLTVFDPQGRAVARLVDGIRGAGDQAVAFEGGGLAPGVYLARLEWNGSVRETRLVRLR